jgi:phosphatidylserine decarboxylase
MRIDPAGWLFVGPALAMVPVAGVLGGLYAAPVVALAAFLLFFFRDPERRSPSRADVVLSPADGRILIAGPADAAAAPPGRWLQISIFLSLMDVHVNRVPVSGQVTQVTYTPGRFLPAYRHNAAIANERCEIWIDHKGQPVVARQIVGILARRVVCRLDTGAAVAAGDRYGVMKFGSRMDVFVPIDSEITVNVGDTVRGGESVVAVLHSSAV